MSDAPRWDEGITTIGVIFRGRELEVLALLAEGLTRQEIAGRCGLSRRMVDNQLEAVYEVLGLSRAWGAPSVRAVRWWLERGRVQPAQPAPPPLAPREAVPAPPAPTRVTIAVNGQEVACVTVAAGTKEG